MGQPSSSGSPIAALFWVRARPGVLGAVSVARGQLALWDLAVTAGGRPTLTLLTLPEGVHAVSASCMGGEWGCLPAAPAAAVSVVIASSAGACVAVALHPAFSVPMEEDGSTSALCAALARLG